MMPPETSPPPIKTRTKRAPWVSKMLTSLAFLSAPLTMGQNVWQSNTSGYYPWYDPASWNTGVTPGFNNGDTAFFGPAQGPIQIDLFNGVGDTILGTLNFSNTVGGRYEIVPYETEALIFNNGGAGALLSQTGNGTNWIKANIKLQENLTAQINAGTLTLSGIISGTGFGLTKNGDGTLVLTGLNTYTGLTTLNGGITLIASVATAGGAGFGTNANGTIVNAGATLALATPIGSNGASLGSEPLTINGKGYLGMGALRGMFGVNTNTFGVVTLGSASTIQNDITGGVLAIGNININHDLRINNFGPVQMDGVISGAGTITKYGMSYLRLQNGNSTFTGTINSILGEVRSQNGAGGGMNGVTAFNLTNSLLYVLNEGSTATTNNRFSDTAPITLNGARIRMQTPQSVNNTETLGAVTYQNGGSMIDMRSSNVGFTQDLILTSLTRATPGSTMYFNLDSLPSGGAQLGTNTQNRIMNSAATISGMLDGWTVTRLSNGSGEFVKYTANGYTALVAADYSIDGVETGWGSAQNIKLTNGGATLTADRTINSLNIYTDTGRELNLGGRLLTVNTGGIMISRNSSAGPTHTISNGTVTAGPGPNSTYELFLHTANANNNWSANLVDNGSNAVSLVKSGPNLMALMATQSYTGKTYLNEGQLREFIAYNVTNPTYSAIGSGNLHIQGSIVGQSTFDTDRDFVRALGAGAGQVQITGGTGSGFGAYGKEIKVNFGGAASPVVWGSSFFNPSVFTLNGGTATHVVSMVNPLDLGGEQRYIRLDGNSSGGGRGVIGRFENDVFNGGIIKRGGGTLLIDNAKTYKSGTQIEEGLVWVRGNGNLGDNITGNDVQIGSAGALHLDSPSNIGSSQRIILQNSSNDNAAAIGFGAGYGDGSGIAFQNFSDILNNGGFQETGGNNIFIANNQAGNARTMAVQMSGMSATSIDFAGMIAAIAPNVRVWFGASTMNGTFIGNSLSPTGHGAADMAYRLGSGGGTLTIQNENVLTGNFPLFVGAIDVNGRTNIGGVVYMPEAQDYQGQLTVGSGGVLVVGKNSSLSSNNQILLRGGELRVSAAAGAYYSIDNQYQDREIDITGANAVMRVESLNGAGGSLVSMKNLRLDGNDRVLTVYSSTTRQNGLLFLGTTTLINAAAGGNSYFDIGFDSQAFNSGFLYLKGEVTQSGLGDRQLMKRNGGTLVLGAANTFTGGIQHQQGNLVLSNVLAAGPAGKTINMAVNSDRTARLNFTIDGAGPHFYDYILSFTGGNNGSNRIVTVGPESIGNSNQEVKVGSMSWAAVSGVTNFDFITDGAHGYRFTVEGGLALGRDINFRTRGALTTINGVVSGTANVLKAEQGTLRLNGNNTYTGTTSLNNGYLVLGHDNALGTATGAVTIAGSTATTQLLLSGNRTLSRPITNSATGGVQTIGGLDVGAKIFTGAITTTRAVNLTAVTGGDVGFAGVVSAAGGINKVGTGTVTLSAATGNTYTGPTIITAGTLIGKAQASGSPFGTTSSFTLGNGTLQFDGQATANSQATTAGALNVIGGGRLVINDAAADSFTTQMTFGSLTRTTNAGTLTIVPQRSSLNVQELVRFTASPTLTNGIVGPWAVATVSGSNNAADYVTVTGGLIATATYGGTGNLNAATGATQTFNAGSTASTLTANRSVYAFRSDANVDLAGFTLIVGNAGQAGIILNNGADIVGIAGSKLNIGTNALSIYVDSAATSSLSVDVISTRDNSTNAYSTNAEPAVNTAPTFIKFGRGNLEINNLLTIQGNIHVNEGTLTAGAANVFGTTENLNAVTGSIVTIAPGATVNLNNFNQEIGNLAGGRAGAEFQFAGGVLNMGTATLTVGRESPGTTATQTYSGQIIGGAGSRLYKLGSGRLILDNISGSQANSLETLDIAQGVLRTWHNDQTLATPLNVSSSIPSSTTVLLRGGEWEAYSVGDNTTNQQSILLGNNIIHSAADSILDVNRPSGAGGNKLMVFGSLTLDIQRFLTTGGNTYIPRFDGLTTMTNHSRLQNDVQMVLHGGVSDGGNGYTMNKIGGSDLTINGDNRATWTGGLVATQGMVYLGTRGGDEIRAPGVTLTTSSTANLGSGDIIINQGFTAATGIRLNAPSNVLVAEGQRVQIYGSETSGTTRVELGTDAPLSAYGLRSTTNGSISLGLGDGGLYTQTIDQAAMGSGRWGISAFQGGTFYMAPTLGAGFDDTYRFTGTSGGVLGLVTANILTGNNSVVLGRSPLDVGNAPTNSGSQIRTYGNQNYTGNTIIHRGADTGSVGNILIMHGDYASPLFDVYGRLEVRGDGRLVNDAGAQVNNVILRPGSALRFDYQMDVNDQFVISRLDNSNLGMNENKWGDNTPMVLDGAQFGLVSSSSRTNQETIGQMTVKGGAGVTLERSNAGQIVLITNGGIQRGPQATLTLRNTTAAELGSAALQSQRFFINDSAWIAANMNNGMFNPWFFSATNLSFLGYDNALGVTNVAYSTSGSTAAWLATLSPTSIAHYNAGANSTLLGTVNAYAMRITGTTTLTGQQINIHSGGLITNGAVTIDSNLYFGTGSVPTEAMFFASDNTVTVNGKVTANNFIRGGPSTIVLANTTNDITGNIQVNGGTLIANAPGTLGTASTITLHTDYFNNNNGAQTPVLALRTAGSAGTYNHSVVIAENVPMARIDLNRSSGSTSGIITIPSLVIQGTSGAAGTLLQIENQNGYGFAVSGATTIGGTSAVGIRVNTGTANLIGAVTASVPLVKSGDGTLRLDGAANNLTGGFTLNRGEWYTVSDTSAVGGSGNVVSNFGVIRLGNLTGTVGTRFDYLNQTMTINGQTTLVTQRVGSTNAHISIGKANNGNTLTTNNSTWFIMQAASYGDQINFYNTWNVNDAPWLRVDSAHALFRNGSTISGTGKLNKAGVHLLGFDNNAANSYSGGTDIWTGELQIRQVNATLGTGAVRLYPGASLAAFGVNSLGTTGLTQVMTSASAFPTLMVRGVPTGSNMTATFNDFANHIAASNIVGGGNGILGLSGGQTLAVDPDFANRNGGIFKTWWLGTSEGNGNFTAPTIAPWGVNSDEFRIGGGHNGTTVLNPSVAGAQLAGAANKLILGGGQNVMGWGTVNLSSSSNNTFGGGTLLTRGRDIAGSLRGFSLNLQGGQIDATTFRTPLGTGTVDVFGDLRIEGASGTARNSTSTNANTFVFHPGSRIRLDNGTLFTPTGATAAEGRWADNAGMALNTTVLEFYGSSTATNAYNIERVGNISVQGGSEIVIRRRGTASAELQLGTITRVGTGTLVLTTMVDNGNVAGILGTTAANTNGTRITAANGALLMSNGMVAPWITSRVDGQFLKYDATLGFQLITQGGAPSNYLAPTATTLTPTTVVTANNGTEILSLNGGSNFTLGGNLDVYALRLERDININAASNFNRINIRSGGLIQFSTNTPTINADLYFGPAGTGDGEAFVSASNNTLQLNGRIYATQFTKSGSAFVNIRSNQSQFTGNWVVNGGGIQFLTPGSASTGEVILNGSRMNDRDSNYNLTEVRYNYNHGSPDLFTWNSGKITGYDINRIYLIAGTDRVSQLPAVDLRTTNTIPGTGQEGVMQFRVDGARSTMRTGTVTLYDHYLLWVDNDRGVGATTGVQFGAGTGVGGINNQGLFDIRKAGIGLMILGDNSGSITGNRSFTIADGGVRVTHNGAFGNSSINAVINSTGALEIAVPNWTPTANLTQAWGSTERWAVNQARGAGNYTLPSGVHLQISANQSGTRTINLSGGSIMGYLPLDWEQQAVNHVLGDGITVNLTADSFLGQLYPAGTSNGSNHFLYDMGKMNTTTNLNPNDPGLRGSYLHINGNITGNHDLTKVGQDVIILSGAANTFRNTNIENGTLQIGRNNTLPTTTELTTKFSGMFDLNGYNQEVAALNGTGGSINNGGFDYNVLTVNQSSNTTYGGQINGTVNLVKNNTGSLLLSAPNSAYVGDTMINAGTLGLTGEGAINESRWIQIGAGAGFNVSGRTGGSYTFDGIVSGGGVGALRADNGSRAVITGSLVVTDDIGLANRTGRLLPGLTTGAVTTAGSQIGHIQITQNLNLTGATASSPVERLTLKLNGATTTLAALGYTGGDPHAFIAGLATGTTNQQGALNGTYGNLSGHDYVNVDGQLTLNDNGQIAVRLADGYTPSNGDVFNLLDWGTIVNNGFTVGDTIRTGGGFQNTDLYLPALGSTYQWNTSLFASHGVLAIVVIPEPGRMLLLFVGFMVIFARRRRA